MVECRISSSLWRNCEIIGTEVGRRLAEGEWFGVGSLCKIDTLKGRSGQRQGGKDGCYYKITLQNFEKVK